MIANNGALPLDAVENKFRAHIFAMRIRLVDLFAHFDKLRSGFITASQFRRCIGAAYDKGVVSPLTQAECDILVSHYDVKKNGMVKWRAFADSIDKGVFSSSYCVDPFMWIVLPTSNQCTHQAHRTIVFGATKLEQTPTKYIPEGRASLYN